MFNLRFPTNYSIVSGVYLNKLSQQTVQGLIEYLFENNNNFNEQMNLNDINLDNFELRCKKGPFGLTSLDTIPKDGNLSSNEIQKMFNSHIIYINSLKNQDIPN